MWIVWAGIFLFFAPAYSDRVLGSAPDWVQRLIPFAVSLVGIGLVLTSKPVMRKLRRRRQRRFAAGTFAVVAAAAAFWAFVVRGWGIAEDVRVSRELLAMNYKTQVTILWDDTINPPIRYLKIGSRTRTSIYVHAMFFARPGIVPTTVDTETSRMIVPDSFYAVNAAQVYSVIEADLAQGTESRVPLFVWVKTENGEQHTIRYVATGTRRPDGSIFLGTQALDVVAGWIK